MPSLYLNLADSLAENCRGREAREVIDKAAGSLHAADSGGYAEFVAFGIRRLQQRLSALDG
jgi:hypothetical protein